MIIEIMLGILILVLIVIASYILFKEKDLRAQLVKIKASNSKTYEDEIELIKQSNSPPEQMLLDFNKIVRRFFRERLNLQIELTYEELAEKLKGSNQDYTDFFNDLTKLNYTPIKPEKQDIIKLMDRFRYSVLGQEKDISIKKEINKEEALEKMFVYEKYKVDMERFRAALEIRKERGLISQEQYNRIIKTSLKGKTPDEWIAITSKKIKQIQASI